MANKFNPGDKVRHVAGGPLMAVEFYNDDLQQYTCSWFVGNRLEKHHFTEEVLEAAQGNVGPGPFVSNPATPRI